MFGLFLSLPAEGLVGLVMECYMGMCLLIYLSGALRWTSFGWDSSPPTTFEVVPYQNSMPHVDCKAKPLAARVVHPNLVFKLVEV